MRLWVTTPLCAVEFEFTIVRLTTGCQMWDFFVQYWLMILFPPSNHCWWESKSLQKSFEHPRPGCYPWSHRLSFLKLCMKRASFVTTNPKEIARFEYTHKIQQTLSTHTFAGVCAVPFSLKATVDGMIAQLWSKKLPCTRTCIKCNQ